MGKRKKEAQAAAQRRFDPNLYSSEEEMKMAARTHQRHRQDPDDSDAAEEIKRIKFEVETDQGARRVRGERERGPGYGYGYGYITGPDPATLTTFSQAASRWLPPAHVYSPQSRYMYINISNVSAYVVCISATS